MAAATGARQRAVREDHIRNHAKLLDAALELFDARGLDVPLREIGAHAGVSNAGVFRHFANRDQLIVEVYERAATALSDRVVAALVNARDESAQERLDTLLNTVVTGMLERPCYGQLAARGIRLRPDSVPDPALVAELGSVIAAGQNAGLLAPDISGTDLVSVARLAAGTLTSGPTPAEQAATAALRKRMMTIVRRGLAPHAQDVAAMPTFSTLAAPDDASE
ncbi:TetR/AcrR family transcriptional regulator [Microbacterium amylolyticum]|uniref:AcrR family transcriptional regulator n=1 Tax=Microbacterium amylolyticum TaxID=936337 RepID=A0ABS4ZI46_9MICO|nr:TetR/AcrR family transcriptional regulator [Microbacterium amylolyticum]MBP2436877.1 AcrR family transcriptional regulator [Microbacterium amylolyticum]